MEDSITDNTQTTQAAVAPAPAAAPTAPAAQVAPQPTQLPDAQPAPSADTPPATFGEPITHEPTGHANLDLVLGFIGKHGLSLDHPAVVAAEGGDFAPIRALLAEKEVPGADAYLALAERSLEEIREAEAAHIETVQQIVVQAAGDETTWEEARAWASANAEPHEKDAVNAALEQGGVVAEAVAAYLVNQFRSATGTTYQPTAPVVKPEAARGAMNPSGGALSPAEYGKAVADLRRAKGVYFEQTAEYRQLQARRAAWRG